MTNKFNHLSRALDKESFEWLQENNEEIANAVAAEVQAGASPDAIRRFILTHVGPDRSGMAARCMSAARWLETQRVSA